ncbi:hypothetical protein BASA61_005374 [Batrachochytrium salamandrivorans]|nr:hypothetical protein BASA61_005374 [Batrachochytrium salamandrivorans]
MSRRTVVSAARLLTDKLSVRLTAASMSSSMIGTAPRLLQPRSPLAMASASLVTALMSGRPSSSYSAARQCPNTQNSSIRIYRDAPRASPSLAVSVVLKGSPSAATATLGASLFALSTVHRPTLRSLSQLASNPALSRSLAISSARSSGLCRRPVSRLENTTAGFSSSAIAALPHSATTSVRPATGSVSLPTAQHMVSQGAVKPPSVAGIDPKKTDSSALATFPDKHVSSSLPNKGVPDGSVPPLSEQLRRIAHLARPELWILLMALVLLCLSSTVSMSVPLSMGTIIDLVLKELGTGVEAVPAMVQMTPRFSDMIKQYMSLPTLFGVLAGVFVVGAAANMGRVILMRTAAERIISRMRGNLFSNIVKQDVGFHDANRSGELISRLSADTVVVGKTLTSYMSDGLRSLVTAGAGITAMLLVNVNLTITMLMIVPPVALGAVFYGRFVRKLSRQTTDSTAEITKFAEEKISNIRTVRAFSQEGKEILQYNNKVHDVYKLGIREALASGLFFGGAGLSGNLVMLAILYHGGNMVQSGAISVGELTTFFLYTVYVGTSVFGLTSWYSDINKGIGASTRLFSLLENNSVIESTAGKRLEKISGSIEFENAHFAYPTRSDVDIFRGLSFTINPGETVAIVGHSGSGKSTIAQLIMRFYDPLAGTVKIDGVDIRELDPHWIRQSVIALVPQEPILFATSVKENIRYGNPSATDEEVLVAAKQANAHEFISTFPDGYDTFVGERGHAISGGQKQRIAIARALLKSPRILVLDEATSALDAASEHLVQEAIDRLILGRTVVTIAHRLSTIQKADRIIMINEGRVVEEGTFNDLMKNESGQFYELVSKQIKQDLDSSAEEDDA